MSWIKFLIMKLFQYATPTKAMHMQCLKKKSTDIYKLRKEIQVDPDLSELSTIEVEPLAVFNGNEESVSGTTLAKILLYSLGSSKSKFKYLHFSNLTGKLFKIPFITGEKIYNKITAAEIDLTKPIFMKNSDNEFLLLVKATSFIRKIHLQAKYKNAKNLTKSEYLKIFKRPNYRFNPSTASLIRDFDTKKNDNKKIFIKTGEPNKKVSIKFIDFKNLKSFESSKAGIINSILTEAEKKLSNYIHIKYLPVEITETLELKNKITKNRKKFYSRINKEIKIVDRVNTKESEYISDILKKEIAYYLSDKNMIKCGKNEKSGALNIRIIHNEDYYQQKTCKEVDQYKSSDHKKERQNITIESFTDLTEHSVKPIAITLIKELLIKEDILQKKLTLFDWKAALQIKKKLTFAISNNKKFFFMDIFPDGNFEFKNLDSSNIFEQDEYKNYIGIIQSEEKKMGKACKFEGLILSENKDINLIFNTDIITLPNMKDIECTLKQVEKELPKELNNTSKIIKVTKNYLDEKKIDKNEQFKNFLKEASELNKKNISKQEFKELITKHLGATKKGKEKKVFQKGSQAHHFALYLKKKYDLIFFFPKDKMNLNNFFKGQININYIKENDKEATYFVGDQREKVQDSYSTATHLRKIKAVGDSELIFKELLPTLDVDFVRTGQSTVLPFPFKYLREYKEQLEKIEMTQLAN